LINGKIFDNLYGEEVRHLVKLLLVAWLVCVLGGAAVAGDIIVEAEAYLASHNEGGAPIQKVTCGAASGGEAVEGFDYPGDWIEVTVTIGNGSFTDKIRSAGLFDSTSLHQSTVYGAGPAGDDLISHFTTYGLGIG
jgi:hypothetical protein